MYVSYQKELMWKVKFNWLRVSSKFDNNVDNLKEDIGGMLVIIYNVGFGSFCKEDK